jgi:hypothetical protein
VGGVLIGPAHGSIGEVVSKRLRLKGGGRIFTVWGRQNGVVFGVELELDVSTLKIGGCLEFFECRSSENGAKMGGFSPGLRLI